MGISHDIISEFVKITNDKKEKPKEETVYATIVQASDGKYVKIDGSDLITPTETTTDIEEGERVTVLIKDHSAIITGNITSPSASVNRVNGIVDVVSEKLGVFEHIVADKIDVNELNAYKATIEHLIVGKAEIEDLKATRAEIEFLDADVAHIKTLVNGNLTSDNILSFNITADKVTMADAFIKDAMVDTINAAKINAGRINTNNVVIGSDDGGMLISGATQQFTDKNGKVRIQIGKDSTGDFTFVLYGEDGTGQIINQNGITASAVSDGLIVNDMINNNAAISGGKLDISSVIFEINNENDTAIHSSKIYLDEQNQSLEVAFNSLKTQVDTIVDISIEGDLKAFTEQIQSNTAKIEMNKSSINTLVSEDAVIRKEVSDLEGNLVETTNTLSSKYSSLEQNMDGFKLEVADVYAKKSTVKDLENNLTTNYTTTEAMNSAITQNATQIATTVARDEVQNMQIGGTNLIGQTSETRGYEVEVIEVTETGWTIRGYNNDRDNAVFRFLNVLDGNGWYTFSFDGTSNATSFRTYVEANDQRVGIVDLTPEWQHFSFTFEVTNYDFDSTGTYTFIEFQRLGNYRYYFKNVKLEHGKIETDYSPCPRDYSTTTQMNSAIIQKADEIASTVAKVEVQNMQIGGTNLLSGTKTLTGAGLNGQIVEKYKGCNVVHQSNNNGSGYKDVLSYGGLILEPSTEYTLSFWAKGGGFISSYLYPDMVEFGYHHNFENRTTNMEDGAINTDLEEGTWKRYAITWKTKPNISGEKGLIVGRLHGEVPNLWCDISAPKLEKGNKPTDWSESPLEYSTTTEMNSAITQKANEITSTVRAYRTGVANLLLNSSEGKGLNNPSSGYHEIHYYLCGDLNSIYFHENRYFCLSFTVGYTGSFNSAPFDSISFQNNWATRWYASDIQKIERVGDNAYRYYMKPLKCAYTFVSADKLTFIGEHGNGNGWFYNVMLTEGELHPSAYTPSNHDYSNKFSEIKQTTDSITSTVSSNYNTLNNKFGDYATKTQMNSAIQQKADEITSTANMTKIGGVELLPQGYRRGNSTSGYSVRTGGTLNCNENGLYTTQSTFVTSDYIAVDPNLPIAYEYDITTSGGTPLTYLGVEQYTGTKEEVGSNAATIYFLEDYLNGNKKGSGTLTLDSNTRYIKFRWLSDWKSTGMSWCQLGGISLKQLGSINQSTKISQMSDSISSTVSSVNNLGSRMSTAESTITQHSNQIATKVDVNGVKSTIQQNPESVRIGFNGISNYFDLTSARLKVGHTDGSYTEIGQNGVMYYANGSGNRYHCLMKQGWLGQISGTSWSRTITLPSEFKGKTFSVIVSVTEVNAVNTHDVIKHFKVTVPHNTVNYTNGTFVINMSALAYYVPGQQSATAIQTDVSWIAIC